MNESYLNCVQSKFEKAMNLHHLAELLNEVERTHFDESSRHRSVSAQELYILSNTKECRYREKLIPKKNGQIRKIDIPDRRLKRVQILLNKALQLIYRKSSSRNSNGFLEGKSILSNARPHTNKRFILNLDIKDFFPSIEFRRIKVVLELNPFKLAERREYLAFVIANLVTYNNSLPQGAPTSPIISNIVCQQLDRNLTRFSKKAGVKYSRYADDLTFSSNKDLFNNNFISILNRIITHQNFKLNDTKTRVRSSMDRQEVTGLIVNRKVNVKREYLNTVRAILNNWEKGGERYAQRIFNLHHHKDFSIDFRKSLRGRIDFIGMVKGKEDPVYQKLLTRFEYLRNRIDYDLIDHDNVRERLVRDNRKMELIVLDKVHSSEDEFIAFCTSAFHQVENLINFFYWKRFPDINDFKDYMWENNLAFQKRYKSLRKFNREERLKKLNNFKRIRDFDINLLIYLYEKEFYYDHHIYCSNELRLLREIRNDESHRCSVYSLDRSEILGKYEALQEKWDKFKNKNGRYAKKTDQEEKLEFQVNQIQFLERRDFHGVRRVLAILVENISKSV